MIDDQEQAYQHAISEPLQVKIEKGIALIKNFEKAALTWDMFEPWYHVCTSGGKDSIVLTWLFQRAGVAFKLYNSLTTLDPPELVRFLRQTYPDVIIAKPIKPILQRLWEDEGQGPPTRLSRWCCEIYKEQGCKGQIKAFGVRGPESNNRKNNWKQWTPRRIDRSYVLNPVLYWTDNDIWTLIKSEKLPYCSLYDEGFKRLGCIGCPMAQTAGRIREFERWPKYREAWQKSFAKFWQTWHGVPRRTETWVSCEGKYPFQSIDGERTEARWVEKTQQIEQGFWTKRRWFDLKGIQTWQELWHWWMQDEEEDENCVMGLF